MWYIIWGILFIAVGILFFLKPEILWKLAEKWKSDYADAPSHLYQISTKFGGIILVIIGIFSLIVAFI